MLVVRQRLYDELTELAAVTPGSVLAPPPSAKGTSRTAGTGGRQAAVRRTWNEKSICTPFTAVLKHSQLIADCELLQPAGNRASIITRQCLPTVFASSRAPSPARPTQASAAPPARPSPPPSPPPPPPRPLPLLPPPRRWRSSSQKPPWRRWTSWRTHAPPPLLRLLPPPPSRPTATPPPPLLRMQPPAGAWSTCAPRRTRSCCRVWRCAASAPPRWRDDPRVGGRC